MDNEQFYLVLEIHDRDGDTMILPTDAYRTLKRAKEFVEGYVRDNAPFGSKHEWEYLPHGSWIYQSCQPSIFSMVIEVWEIKE